MSSKRLWLNSIVRFALQSPIPSVSSQRYLGSVDSLHFSLGLIAHLLAMNPCCTTILGLCKVYVLSCLANTCSNSLTFHFLDGILADELSFRNVLQLLALLPGGGNAWTHGVVIRSIRDWVHLCRAAPLLAIEAMLAVNSYN